MVEPGELKKIWCVVCGLCGRADTPPGETKAATERRMRHEEGYKCTKRYGWLCRWCVEEQVARE
jgi:hypothetical protein